MIEKNQNANRIESWIRNIELRIRDLERGELAIRARVREMEEKYALFLEVTGERHQNPAPEMEPYQESKQPPPKTGGWFATSRPDSRRSPDKSDDMDQKSYD